MNEHALDKLAAPTPASAIKYLPKSIDRGNPPTAIAIPYVSARFVQTRLDEAFGPLGWQTDVKDIRGFVCVGIGVRGEDGHWIWRWDTGQEDQTEASGDEADEAEGEDDIGRGGAKAIISRGLKRCGVQFGIARDIYDYPKRRYKVTLANGKFRGWAEEVNPTSRQPAGKNGSPKAEAQDQPPDAPRHADEPHVDESLVFSKFAKDNHATTEQIAKAIKEATPEGGKTDWPAARRALGKAIDTVPF